MISDFALQRLYFGIGWVAGDHMKIKPNTVYLTPVRPPRQASALIVGADEAVEIPGQMCLLFRVEAVGPLTRAEDLAVQPGDIVCVASRALDILHPNTNFLMIDAKHILSIVGG